MSRIGAIWKLDTEYSLKINPNWNDGIFVFLSDDCKYWSGARTRIIIDRGVPYIGDKIPYVRPLLDAALSGAWETVRQDLLNDRLGDPDEGVNLLIGTKKQATGGCTCGLYVMMRGGCPSNRGLPCPDIHDDDE